MNAMLETASTFLQNSNVMAVFLDAALKSTLVLVFTSMLCLCWRRASAATRHWIWFLGVAALLCLPLLSFMARPWQKPIWQLSTGLSSANEFTVAVEFGSGQGSAMAEQQAQRLGGALALPKTAEREREAHIVTRFDRQWLLIALAVWLAGVVTVFSHMIVGHVRLRRIRGDARAFKVLLFEELCERLDVRRPVALLQSANKVMPVTWGWW